MGNENDFKYVLQDFSNVYIGTRLTYGELVQLEDTPQKLRSAVYQYIYREADARTRICDHILSIKEDSMSYLVFTQLKGQIKIVFPESITDKKGKTKTQYRTETYSIADIVTNEELRNSISPEQITEYIFKKLRLVSLAV